MKRTYVDAGILIRAARGNDTVSEPAIDILCDPDREFVASAMVRLEVLPGAKKPAEIEFYETFFKQVAVWVTLDPHLLSTAIEEATVSRVSPMDALHLVLAASAGCHEFVTSQQPDAPIHTSKRLAIIGL